MLQHDMKHHLIELLSLTKEQNNVSEIKNYILNMKEFMENHQEYTHSGNKEIDSLLNYMLQEADKQLNKVDYRINIPTELDIRPFDLNVILGNLLDNAIYAASHSKKKELAIRLNYDTGLLFIDVCNTYEGEIEVYKEIYLTTKMDSKNHGIGLQNVKKIVEEYNGTLEITHDNSIFDVKIMLYTLK